MKNLKNNSFYAKAKLSVITSMAFVLLFVPTTMSSAFADNEVAPAPPSIGASVPLTYFGPSPSMVQPELVGPYQLLKSGKVDLNAGTITLPLYEGKVKINGGKTTTNEWYILTDTDDKGNADQLGLNYSPKLTYSSVGARNATLQKDTTWLFDGGAVDFKPVHGVTPNAPPNAFPPKVYQAGSIGDKDYSPVVRVLNAGDHIYDAPIVAFGVDAKILNAFCNGNPDYNIVHDKVVKICPQQMTVTLKLTSGFSFSRPVLYLSMDSNNPLTAALEGVTYAPGRLNSITTGHDDSASSAIERLFAFINGPTGKDNPQRQGFNSALIDGPGLGPLNVLGGIPTVATDYSPLWDANLAQWTQKAIDNGYRSRLIDEFTILGFIQKGWVTGPNGNPFGTNDIIVNCPIVYRFL
ncbi:MAG: hypothetical protein WBF33_18025 [Candidatus Nitrosopolaris sp.]